MTAETEACAGSHLRPVLHNKSRQNGWGQLAERSDASSTEVGEELDARTDLFSFGAVLYEMATGKPPFAGGSSALIFEAILNRSPVSPMTLNSELPDKVVEIIGKALEKDRDVRYQHAADLLTDLKRLKGQIESSRVVAIHASPDHTLKNRKLWMVQP